VAQVLGSIREIKREVNKLIRWKISKTIDKKSISYENQMKSSNEKTLKNQRADSEEEDKSPNYEKMIQLEREISKMPSQYSVSKSKVQNQVNQSQKKGDNSFSNLFSREIEYYVDEDNGNICKNRNLALIQEEKELS